MRDFFVSMLIDAAVNQPFIGFLQDVLVLRILVYYYLPNTPEVTSYPRLLNAAFEHARGSGTFCPVSAAAACIFSGGILSVLPTSQ
jgi:hypothetical protein